MGAWFRWLKEIYEGKKALGQSTVRGTSAQTGVTYDLFTISGGRIMVTQIIGEITVAVVGALTISLLATPTTGTARAMCAGLLTTGYAIGDLFGITGVNTDAMLPPASSSVVEAQTMGVMVSEGVISLVNDIVDVGAIQWTLKWIPIDNAAAVVAA